MPLPHSVQPPLRPLAPNTRPPPLEIPPIQQPPQQQQQQPSQQQQRPPSPVAPEYSPITPKIQPALPATVPTHSQNEDLPMSTQTEARPVPPATSVVPSIPIAPSAPSVPVAQPPAPDPALAPTAQYIPQPPALPFSSEDSTDAIALRAAISALQFQKKKAQDDVRALEQIKTQAMADPIHFRNELAAGNLSEDRPKMGGIQAILEASDSEDESDNEQAKAGASETDPAAKQTGETTGARKDDKPSKDSKGGSFKRIPGPQTVVRTPYINWEKYHIVGEPLDAMHEQQRRWPGSTGGQGMDKGREYSIAAPFSPFLDILDSRDSVGGHEMRKDSAGINTPGIYTPTGSISEHPMETRRGMSRPS